MNNTKYKVLVVDDLPENIRVLADALKDDYEVSVAPTGERALEIIASDNKPDIVLLDVKMPGLDGYEVCRQIREDQSNQFVPVVFVSAADTLEEKLKGYEAGASDYVVKPFSVDEILNKVKLLIESIKVMKQLKTDVNYATKTAMTALTSAGEMGQVIDFFRRSFSCRSLEEMAELLLNNLASSQLNCVVMLNTQIQKIYKTLGAPVSPLEIAVIDKLRVKETIYDFGKRTIINYPGISLLIKNMPLDDAELYGRIKDNLALLVEGASVRIGGIETERRVREKQLALNTLIGVTEKALNDIDERQKQQRLTSESIMQQLQENVASSFVTLGLDEEQEDKLLDLVSTAAEKEQKNFDQGKLTDQHLAEILKLLQRSPHKDGS